MRNSLRLAAVGLAILGISDTATGYTIDFFLDTYTDAANWVLYAKTDAPGGIASYSVQLQGHTGGGVNLSPWSTFGNGERYRGFIILGPVAAGAQDTTNPASVVYGIGYRD